MSFHVFLFFLSKPLGNSQRHTAQRFPLGLGDITQDGGRWAERIVPERDERVDRPICPALSDALLGVGCVKFRPRSLQQVGPKHVGSQMIRLPEPADPSLEGNSSADEVITESLRILDIRISGNIDDRLAGWPVS